MTKKVHRTRSDKFVLMYSHYDRFEDDEDDIPLFVGILCAAVLAWWGLVHVVDMFFNKLVWWQEPLTIIPVLIIMLPLLMANELYGKNPLHWWPAIWGTKVNIPDSNDFKEENLKEFGPSNVYMIDPGTLKFRRKKDAMLYCLKYLS